jgi:Acyltransferase family
MNLDRRSSDRITVLRFPLIVLVVFIHAYGVGHYRSEALQSVNDLSISDLTQYFISRGLAAVAVPLFYLTSGYLFFLGAEFGVEFFRTKFLSRVRTLLIPFLFWNMATLLAIMGFQDLPQTSRIFSGGPYSIGAFDLQHYSMAVLGIGRMPISYQTWFIRDLMVMVLLSPVVAVLLVHVPRIVLGVLFLAWWIGSWPMTVPSAAAALFFYAGAYLAMQQKSIFCLDGYGKPAAVGFGMVLLINMVLRNYYLTQLAILFGITAILYGTNLLVRDRRVVDLLFRAAPISFFVFAAHEPLVSLCKRLVAAYALQRGDAVSVAIYFAIPVCVIGVCVALYLALQSVIPKCMAVVSGGR